MVPTGGLSGRRPMRPSASPLEDVRVNNPGDPRAFVVDASTLEHVLELVEGFVTVVDRDGFIRYINRAEPEFARGDAIGVSAESFVSPASRHIYRAAFSAAWSSGEPQEYEIDFPAPDGTVRWHRARMTPLVEGRTVVAVVVLSSNITELKTAQATIEHLRALLPVCAWCGRIRNECDEWVTTESYLARNMSADVSHGMCPDCFERQMGSLPNAESPAP
jgi:PAS domain S-box-containing protein